MSFIADLHIHSRFSIATSRDLTVQHLAAWAQLKGIDILGSGDFTHPVWRKELGENLIFDEASGLYKPKLVSDFSCGAFERHVPLFCLQTEISCIYKRDGKVRKVHNLVFMPDLESADRFSTRLALLGKLANDGRPILRLDSRELLEIALEISPQAVLIPAHIWTPWFALFGSKSGFDSIEECFGDLTPHIFALETGLSSDPPMNRLLSALDNFVLISNSDAHSGANLGREANLFSGKPSYQGLFNALRAASRREIPHSEDCEFLGTLEYYPEEGKYHLDGHRACGISLTPAETKALDYCCPVCGKLLTVGTLHRITDLADRSVAPHLVNEPETRMLVPLPEVVSQIIGINPGTRSVERKCAEIVSGLGAELNVLCLMELGQIRAFWEPLGEAVARIRAKKIRVQAGFDGQYGKINIFEPGELPKSAKKR